MNSNYEKSILLACLPARPVYNKKLIKGINLNSKTVAKNILWRVKFV